MTSANSLRTLGCISPGPIDLCTFRFLRWSRAWSSITLGRALPLWTPSCSPSTGEGRRERLPVKTEAECCWVPQPSPHLLIHWTETVQGLNGWRFLRDCHSQQSLCAEHADKERCSLLLCSSETSRGKKFSLHFLCLN